jgi:hypothetical protein
MLKERRDRCRAHVEPILIKRDPKGAGLSWKSVACWALPHANAHCADAGRQPHDLFVTGIDLTMRRS